MLDIMKVFGEDNMAILIGHTDKDTSGTFEDLNAAIQVGERSNITHCSITPKQHAIWTAFVAKEAAPTYHFHEAAYEAAAKLVMDTWIEYPRPGTEQPYTPAFPIANQHRRKVRNELFLYAEKLRNKIEEAVPMMHNHCCNYIIATLYDKLCW